MAPDETCCCLEGGDCRGDDFGGDTGGLSGEEFAARLANIGLRAPGGDDQGEADGAEAADRAE